MIGSVEATGSRSEAADINYSIHKIGLAKVGRRFIPYISEEDERVIREELAGNSGDRIRSRFRMPQPLLVDLHQSDMSGADALETGTGTGTQTEELLSRVGRRFPVAARSLAIGYLVWQLRRPSR